MTTNRRKFIVSMLLLSLWISGCGPGQMWGPTFTPSPTPTFTPTVTVSPTMTPSRTPTTAATPTATATSTAIPTFTATATPTVTATRRPVVNTKVPVNSDKEEGASYETAIVIQAANEFEGIALEDEWIAGHYPGYQETSQAVSFFNGKVYDSIMIVTSTGMIKTIYFDITSFFGKL